VYSSGIVLSSGVDAGMVGGGDWGPGADVLETAGISWKSCGQARGAIGQELAERNWVPEILTPGGGVT
jgi:hypothetical protein